jgi:drug/metabolite transporter (DMT)-like permease
MVWLFLSVCLYAVNNVLWKVFIKGHHPLRIITQRAIFTVLIAFGAAWINDTDLFEFIHNPNSIYVIIASLFGTAGLVMMVTFLKEGSLVQMAFYSLLGTGIAASYTYLFREENLTTKSILGSVLMILGYFIFCFYEHKKVKAVKTVLKQHFLLIGMTLAFSVSLLIQWESLKIFPPLAIICTQETIVLIATFVVGLFLKPTESPQNPRSQTTLKMALMALVIFAGIFMGTIGLKSADPFLASVTSFAVPVLTVIFGGVLFMDRLNLMHAVSLVLMIMGGVCLI